MPTASPILLPSSRSTKLVVPVSTALSSTPWPNSAGLPKATVIDAQQVNKSGWFVPFCTLFHLKYLNSCRQMCIYLSIDRSIYLSIYIYIFIFIFIYCTHVIHTAHHCIGFFGSPFQASKRRISQATQGRPLLFDDGKLDLRQPTEHGRCSQPLSASLGFGG